MFLKRTQTGRRNRTQSSLPGVERLEARQLMAGDTGRPLISVSVPTQVSRTSDADFIITLDKAVPAGQTLTVQYGTRNLGAVEGKDFDSSKAPTKGAVTFQAGESMKVIDIHTLPLPASAKASPKPFTFALDITSATSGKIAQKSAITNIVNEAAGFQIDISFSGNVSDKTKVAARQAADKWQNVITGDLPSVVIDGEYIDDFKLVVKEQAVDGLYGALAYAGPTRTYANGESIIQKRATSNTSYGGTAVVDIADRNNDQIKDIMVHELGHALGIGPFWRLEHIRNGFKPLGLIQNLFTDSPIYVGKNALAEYRKLAPGAVGIPLESGGGGGTRGAHWSEAVFGNELMTGYLSPTMPLSRVTLGALKDLGYSVNYAKADPYSLPTATVAAAGLAAANASSIRLAPVALFAGSGGDIGSSTTFVSAQTSTSGAGTTSGRSGSTSRGTTTTQTPAAPVAPRATPAAAPKVATTLAPSKAAGFGSYGR